MQVFERRGRAQAGPLHDGRFKGMVRRYGEGTCTAAELPSDGDSHDQLVSMSRSLHDQCCTFLVFYRPGTEGIRRRSRGVYFDVGRVRLNGEPWASGLGLSPPADGRARMPGTV
jgi:hypothetical protein